MQTYENSPLDKNLTEKLSPVFMRGESFRLGSLNTTLCGIEDLFLKTTTLPVFTFTLFGRNAPGSGLSSMATDPSFAGSTCADVLWSDDEAQAPSVTATTAAAASDEIFNITNTVPSG